MDDQWEVAYALSIGAKTTILNGLEGCTLFKTRASFGAHHENLNEDRPILSDEDVAQ